MGCGCNKRRQVTAAGERVGYYVIRPDGTEVPKVSEGESAFMSALEANAEVRAAGGGTIRVWKRKPAR
jgi:hypothetical protein